MSVAVPVSYFSNSSTFSDVSYARFSPADTLRILQGQNRPNDPLVFPIEVNLHGVAIG